jgi:N-acetylmuramoyl-L-alanine amidase
MGGSMKAYNFKKYTIFLCALIILIFSLYLSTNNISLNISKIYAAKETKASSLATKNPSSGSDVTGLLARLINGEARGETYQGQVAVGAVILNRVKSPEFPNTISGVIYQKGQFSCVTDGQFNKPIDKNSTIYKAAKEAMNGSDPSNGALFFYNAKTTKSKWLFTLKTVKVIGQHTFAVSGGK